MHDINQILTIAALLSRLICWGHNSSTGVLCKSGSSTDLIFIPNNTYVIV